MIILEGPDNAGKTVLSQQLMHDLGMVTVKSPGPMEDLSQWSKWMYWSMVQKARRYTIYDRHPFISEPIYGPTCRGVDKLEAAMKAGWWVKEAIQVFKVDPRITVVFCETERNTMMDFQKPEMDGVIENYEQILIAYEKRIEELRREIAGAVLYYDWVNDHYGGLRDILEERVKNQWID